MIKWGIIGCGDVTEVKSGPAFNKVNNSLLHAVMRRSAEKAADYAKRHNVGLWYSDALELINNPDINAVYIATPPKYHEVYAVAALEIGKFVYVEKPVTISVASCKRMAAAVKKYDGKLCVAQYRRALPMFQKIKQLIDENTIGKIKLIRLNLFQPHDSSIIAKTDDNWRVIPALSGGGLFYDLAPHQIDIMIHLFGELTESFGVATNQSQFYNAEDAVSGVVKFNNNILFNGNWNFSMPEFLKEDSCQVIGEQGYIEFPFFGSSVKLFKGNYEEVFSFQHPTHIQQPMIEKVVNYFLGKDENPCSINEALKSLEVMESFVYGKGGINNIVEN